jgi:hypothetical protein
MKSFIDHLQETQKTYEFRIKIANFDPTPEMNKLESVLEAYGVETVSSPTSLPIAENNIDFPSMGPCEVYVIEAVLTYPATDQQLRSIISERWCCCPEANIVVIPRSHPEELWRDNEGELREYAEGENVLDADMSTEANTASEDYATLKVLQKDNYKSMKHDIVPDTSTEKGTGKTTNDLPQGTDSPVGSK